MNFYKDEEKEETTNSNIETSTEDIMTKKYENFYDDNISTREKIINKKPKEISKWSKDKLKRKIGGENNECKTYCKMGWWKKTINR